MKKNEVDSVVESMLFFNKIVGFLTDEKFHLSPFFNGEVEQDELILTLSNTLADEHLYGFIIYHRLEVLSQLSGIDLDRSGDTTIIRINRTKFSSVLKELTKAVPSLQIQ